MIKDKNFPLENKAQIFASKPPQPFDELYKITGLLPISAWTITPYLSVGLARLDTAGHPSRPLGGGRFPPGLADPRQDELWG